MTTWVYQQSEPRLWTVGFYEPSGRWHPESDHATPERAAGRCHWLNGGPPTNHPEPRSSPDAR